MQARRRTFNFSKCNINALYCDYKPCTKTILQEKTAQENVACGTVALDFDEKQTKNVAQITM